jgi:hypothetical protein
MIVIRVSVTLTRFRRAKATIFEFSILGLRVSPKHSPSRDSEVTASRRALGIMSVQ